MLDFTVGSDSLNIADLLSLVPREYMKKAEGLKGTGIAQVSIAITGTLTDSTSADLAGTVTARGASIQYPQLPKPITDITVLSVSRERKRNRNSVSRISRQVLAVPQSAWR